MGPRFGLLVLAVFAAVVAAGVLSGNSQSQTVATPQVVLVPTALPVPGPHEVDIVASASPDLVGAYLPAILRARVGEVLTWRNTADVGHSVVADNGAFTSAVLNRRQVFRWSPTKPGRYVYGCFIHPNMRGEIDVQP